MLAGAARVRDAGAADAGACAAIYAPYVTDTAITFESVPPDAAELTRRIAQAARLPAWLVLEDRDDGHVLGYAYGSPYKPRPAYRWSCEVSVYLDLRRRGAGGGRLLYEVLLARLAGRGYRMVIAGMTLPNPASEGLHRALGFEPVGTFSHIGFKLGTWHDVALLQKSLATGPGAPRGIR